MNVALGVCAGLRGELSCLSSSAYLVTDVRSAAEARVELSLSTRTVDGWTVVTVSGEVDVYTAPRLRERLVELVDNGSRQMIVNLDPVDFLDSTGLGVMVGALKRLRTANGVFGLVCSREPLLKIFRITALDQVFPIYPTVADAIEDPPETNEEEFTYEPPPPPPPPPPKPKKKPKAPSAKKAKATTNVDTPTTKKAEQRNDRATPRPVTSTADADHRIGPSTVRPPVATTAPLEESATPAVPVPRARTEPETASQTLTGNAGWEGYWNGYSFTASQSGAMVAMYTRYHLSLMEISGRIGVPVHDVRKHLRSVGVHVSE